MFGISKKKLSTESYKGVRDFYPEDQTIQNYIFKVMRETAEAWGYNEYGASVLEPLELYKSKTSEEIVNEQIYSFKDRGGREVALRPEMTPTAARMIAARIQELPMPIRWYSIPNLFRYEKPQRGRLREHWQLNVDIFGNLDFMAEVEVISIAYDLMKRFGAGEKDFEIWINNRAFLDDVLKKASVDEDKKQFVYRLLDKKLKMTEKDFNHALNSLIGDESAKILMETIYFGEGLLTTMKDSAGAKYLNQVINNLRNAGISNLKFKPTLTRGFDYYTGIVFEVFDTNKENPRAMFGGGRFDDLVGSFSSQSISGFGFGMGDVTIRDFLTTRNLLPDFKSRTNLYICVAPETPIKEVYKIAETLRSNKINTAVDISGKKLSDQLKSLDRRKISYVMTVGPDELENQNFVVRNTETREEQPGNLEEIIKILK
ncbi:MAG: histidine--tRNA ligase [Candidatus Zambryskibacteria bacterium]|nr:histidine--tRNA ligase [Candidatus Zambryskibacteria bacterium]